MRVGIEVEREGEAHSHTVACMVTTGRKIALHQAPCPERACGAPKPTDAGGPKEIFGPKE
jgi:hypothetical protein